jgi:hypothetical protein
MKRSITTEKGFEFQMLWIGIKPERFYTITIFIWVVKSLSFALGQGKGETNQ